MGSHFFPNQSKPSKCIYQIYKYTNIQVIEQTLRTFVPKVNVACAKRLIHVPGKTVKLRQ